MKGKRLELGLIASLANDPGASHALCQHQHGSHGLTRRRQAIMFHICEE